jgi:hypothetical protein
MFCMQATVVQDLKITNDNQDSRSNNLVFINWKSKIIDLLKLDNWFLSFDFDHYNLQDD